MAIKELKDYVIVDLETTGFNKSDEILEIGALRVNNHFIVQSFNVLIKPTKHIPEDASAVHHIYDETVANQYDIRTAIYAFSNFIKDDDIILGHNISGFDVHYLQRDFKDCLDKEFNNQLYDTLYVSRREMRFLGSHSLGMLAAYYGIDYSKAHRALQDCFINYKVYEKMLHDNFDKEIKICPKCGNILKLRIGKYGWFYSCSKYPNCNYSERFTP